jgi:hypothetical protein
MSMKNGLRIAVLASLGLVLAVGALLAWNGQRTRHANAQRGLEAELANARELLDRAARLAPHDDAEHGALTEALHAARAELQRMQSGFVDEKDADAQVREALAAAGASAGTLQSLRRSAQQEREFYRRHDYALLFASVREARDAAERLRGGALLHGWSGVSWPPQRDDDAGPVLATLHVFSVHEEVWPAFTRMSVCEPREDEGVWWPPYASQLRALHSRRIALCAEGDAHPRRTRAIGELDRVKLEMMAVRPIVDAIAQWKAPLETPQP